MRATRALGVNCLGPAGLRSVEKARRNCPAVQANFYHSHDESVVNVRETMEAAVVGSGPNGLAAAISMAEAGYKVRVYEAAAAPGGATRTEEVTLPGFRHDLGSAIHPLAAASPFFESRPFQMLGLQWVQPDAPLAHPLDDGTAVMLEANLEKTADGLGADRQRYLDFFAPLVESWPKIRHDVLAPVRIPSHPFQMVRFGLSAMLPASWLCRMRFEEPRARALFGGIAAHSMIPLSFMFSSAIGVVLGIAAHIVGWPFPRGGSCRIAESMIRYLESLGGSVELNHRVSDLGELSDNGAVLCDLTPAQFERVAGKQISQGYRHRLRHFRYGVGVFKMDWALSQPIPWKAKECLRAATVHVGGQLEEIEESEKAAWYGRCSDRPFVLLAQPSLFDPSRAPRGKHTAWAYCRVPGVGAAVGRRHGQISQKDMTAAIEDQIERFAPGFRDCILARKSWNPQEMEAWDSNLIGGDIAGGALTWDQLFLRPGWRMYDTPIRNVFLCSSSTPPGPGVHGMCGFHAAERAKDVLLRE